MAINQEPKVSVLMTLYNKGEFVVEAIDSILKGTYGDLEVLVMDDASTDDGPAKVRAINDPRIRLVTAAKNGGRAAAANRGYEAARGEYIAVLDADDTAHPERLAKQVTFMDAHPEVGVCGTAARYFGAREGIDRWPATDPECRAKLLFTDPVLYGSSIIRRSVLIENNLRSNEQWHLPAEDYIFMNRVSEFTQFANLPEPLLNYRIGEQNQRHGRDPVHDKEQVCRYVFGSYGIAATDEEFALQLMFHKLKKGTFNSARVRSLWNWRAKLITMNRSRQLFPVDLFEKHIAYCWDTAYYLLADDGIGAAITHMRLSGKWPLDRLVYLAKVTLKGWLGRK